MKKLILAALLVFVISEMDAQIRATWTAARHFRTGETYSTWAHDSTGAQVDTMTFLPVYNSIEVYYSIRSEDSVSIIVAYQPSYDGVNFGAPVTIDSLSTAAATSKSIALPTGALGLAGVRFVRTVQAYRLGVTSPNLHEQIVTKR